MHDSTTSPTSTRSTASLHFEDAVRAAAKMGGIPRLTGIDFAGLRAFAPWVAIIDPDDKMRTLKFALVGAGLSAFFGHDLTGQDYLDIVDPAIKGDAYDSAFLMLSRPCGLWQMTPILAADDSKFMLEYTGFPMLDHVHSRAQIMFLIQHPFTNGTAAPRIKSARHSTEWRWLEMREHARR